MLNVVFRLNMLSFAMLGVLAPLKGALLPRKYEGRLRRLARYKYSSLLVLSVRDEVRNVL